MSKIRVIKKKDLVGRSVPLETNEEKPPAKSAERGTVAAIENWIADWHEQTEIKTRMALRELAQLRLRDSAGM